MNGKSSKREREKGRKGASLYSPPSPLLPCSLAPLLPLPLSRSRLARRGFTLLEVILALAILAGALAVLGEVSRLALRNAAAARDLARAQMLAESKLAEIASGITSPDPIDGATFDTTLESLDPSEPAWLYSISRDSTDEEGLISVRVTVTRDLPPGQNPVKFSLVRWLPDPNYTPPGQNSDQNTGDTSSTSGTTTSGGN